MALQRAYTQFLAAPNSDALATTASLHYITSTTSHSGSTDIIKHLNTVRNQIKKKKQDVLQAVEGQKAIAVEVDTILEFVTSGGPYLPGLDDNFLADRTVQLPVTHMVTFDDQGKISQIRQSWDQGALLKQVDVIGKSGRNWPIRDSKDQIKLITKSLAAAGDVPPPSAADAMARSRTNSTNILRDPHASLSLFGPREELENNPANAVSPYAGKRPPQRSFDDILSEEHSEETPRAVVTPYAGARPRQRSFTEILGDEEDEEPESPTRGRPSSPTKAIAPKAGADKKFQPNRLFESDGSDPVEEDAHENRSPDRFYRPHPKKFDHFELAANPEDAPQPGQPMDKVIKRAKHGSQWDFEDFVTPAKPKPLINRRAQDVRHWGNTDDDGHESPEKKPAQHKPRKDAEPHFEFVDDGEDTGQPRLVSRPRGATHNSGLGLYENKVTGEDGSADADAGDDRALGNITNLKDRRKDFDSHFMMADDSPNRAAQSSAKVSDDRKKAVKMMEANWSAYDSSPASQKENNPRKAPARTGEDRGINTQGNGMGGKKGAGRGWSIGGESDEEPTPAAPARKQGAAHKASDFWDF